MKNVPVVLVFSAAVVFAHDHVEVGADPLNSSRLAFDGPSYQLAVYVPRGEPFSGYMPQFPGGWHVAELTFTTDCSALEAASGAEPRVEFVSISGPAGGTFSFWEAGETQPTWSRSAGWSSASGAPASFVVAAGGDAHIHGRCFAMNKPGIYSVTFRAVDMAGAFQSGVEKTVTFVAQQPPQLAIAIQDGEALLSFTSRSNLVYDLQVCTHLYSGAWSNVETHRSMDGDGGTIRMTDPLADRVAAFYRLVEYY